MSDDLSNALDALLPTVGSALTRATKVVLCICGHPQHYHAISAGGTMPPHPTKRFGCHGALQRHRDNRYVTTPDGEMAYQPFCPCERAVPVVSVVGARMAFFRIPAPNKHAFIHGLKVLLSRVGVEGVDAQVNWLVPRECETCGAKNETVLPCYLAPDMVESVLRCSKHWITHLHH